MEEVKDPEVQETPTEEPVVEQVTITKKELEDLTHKAEVSSQNFERLKAKEQELSDLQSSLQENEHQSGSDMIYTDEGSVLKKEIDELKKLIKNQSNSTERDKLFTKHPILKEHEGEFDTFSKDPENQGMPLATMAKAFLIENDLLQKAPRRKGLEKPTGGKVTKSPSGKLSGEDAKRLRETNPRKYQKMIEAGTLEISDDE